MSRSGPEAKLIAKMKAAGQAEYGGRLVIVKYHGSAYSQSGVSDLLCVLDGIFIACEVKAPESYSGSVEKALTKGPTVLQRQFIKDVLDAGGVAGFAATVEQFMEILVCAEQTAFSLAPGQCLGHNL